MQVRQSPVPPLSAKPDPDKLAGAQRKAIKVMRGLEELTCRKIKRN